MTASTGTANTAAAATTTATDAGTATTSTAADAATAQAATAAATDMPDWVKDPEQAWKVIQETRLEAGDKRIALTAAEAARTAAETKAQAVLDAIAKATGQAAETDPVKLASDLTAAQDAAKDAARELAIFKAAGSAADPVKLLDRTSFMNAVRGIDPADGTALAAAIEAAVKADPTLKSARAAGASGIEQTGGSGEQGQISEEQLKNMTPEQIVEAHKKGQLNHLL